MSSKKYESWYGNLKKKRIEKLIESQKETFDKFLTNNKKIQI